MQTLAALRLMVSHFDNGLEGMAIELGKSPETLRKELSGKSAQHKLSVITAGLISAACIRTKSLECRAYVNAVASESGGRLELIVEESSTAAQDPCSRFSNLLRETSDVAIAWTEGMADGVLNDNELARLEKEVTEAEASLQRLRQCARSINAAGKPVQLRSAA